MGRHRLERWVRFQQHLSPNDHPPPPFVTRQHKWRRKRVIERSEPRYLRTPRAITSPGGLNSRGGPAMAAKLPRQFSNPSGPRLNAGSRIQPAPVGAGTWKVGAFKPPTPYLWQRAPAATNQQRKPIPHHNSNSHETLDDKCGRQKKGRERDKRGNRSWRA